MRIETILELIVILSKSRNAIFKIQEHIQLNF
jgi:hypothetical protein